MKKTLIRKHLLGTMLTPAWTADTFDDLPTRKYYWRLWTPEMKVKTDYHTGEPLDETWQVLVDDLGNIVDTANPLVLADYAALLGSDHFTVEHPGVTFTFDKDTGLKFVQPTGETADERIERISNAPIVTQELWEKIKLLEDEERFGLTPEGHEIYLHLKDAEANSKTPGAGMLFGVPLALGVGSAMFLSNPFAFTGSLIGAEVGGKSLNFPFQLQGYKSFGDWLIPDASETTKELSNLGTWLGGGMGWTALKNADTVFRLNLLKSPTLLADKYAARWATEDANRRSVLEFLDIFSPKTTPETIDATPKLNVTRKPGVFYAKAGDLNKGSLVSKIKDAANKLFKNDPVWNFMEKTGIPEEQRAAVEKVLLKPNFDPNKSWYTDPWNNITYEIKTPLATDDLLMNEFAMGITSRFKLYRNDPKLKAAILQEMGWDEDTYNRFLDEITKKMREDKTVGVTGKDELKGYLAETRHSKIENPNYPTRYATEYLINRDRIAGESNSLQEELQYAKEAGLHEGYHGITSGIDGEEDAIAKGLQNEYPLMTALMERNRQFLLKVSETLEWYNYFNNTPVYQVVSDLEASGFTPQQIEYVTEFGLPRAKSYNKYILEPQETSARDIVSTTLGQGTKNEELLRNVYTPESFNLFHGNLFSRVGDINEGSLVTPTVNLFKATPDMEDTIKKFFTQMILSGGDSAGLYGDISKGLPKNILDYLLHNVIGRRILAGEKEGWWTDNVANKAKEAMDDVTIGEFPLKLFDDAGEGFSGQYNPKNNFIAVSKDSKKFTPNYIKAHEGDHLIDKTIPLTDELERVITKALDDDFLDLPNKENAGVLKGYLHMKTEKTTTIHDAVRRLLSSEQLKWDIHLLNTLIDKLPDDKIFKAVELANGYGRRYIEFLKETNNLTHEKALLFREAMKVVCTIGDANRGSAIGASRRPILRKNMHEFSDAEWDAAYDAALEKGNKREMWRLLTLRFLLKAKEFIADGGGAPKVLYRGDWRDCFLNFKKDGVWLSSDPLYALNYTEDRIAKDKIFYPSKVYKYFVKGNSELLLPKSIYPNVPAKDDYYWDPITSYLMFGVPNELRRFATITNGENNLLKLLKKPSKKLTAPLKKAYKLGSADVIVGQDSPVSNIKGYEYWHPSQGLEYYVADPKYVKSANLITYDNNGNMIPLSLRFNFRYNDRRYGWLLPLIPFLTPNKKDQAN